MGAKAKAAKKAGKKKAAAAKKAAKKKVAAAKKKAKAAAKGAKKAAAGGKKADAIHGSENDDNDAKAEANAIVHAAATPGVSEGALKKRLAGVKNKVAEAKANLQKAEAQKHKSLSTWI